MRNRSFNKAETFHGSARFAGQRDHERAVNDGGEATRENRVRRDLHRLGAHHFTKTGYLHAHDLADRFRGDVALGYSSTASRQNQTASLRGKTADRVLNSLFLIGHDRFSKDIPAMLFSGRFHRRAAKVPVLTAAGAIGNGNYANDNLHFAQTRAVILSRADGEGSHEQGWLRGSS